MSLGAESLGEESLLRRCTAVAATCCRLLAPCLLAPCLAAAESPLHRGELRIATAEYQKRLEGMWLGQSIANWTGLVTEGACAGADPFAVVQPPIPFLTDADWGGTADPKRGKIDFAFHDPWGADDDTDIEYVYLHAMAGRSSVRLSPADIAAAWRAHIKDFVWGSDKRAVELIGAGVLPPSTSLPAANAGYLFIDAQLTTEFFGLFAPGLPDAALSIANLPIRTTAANHAAHAAQFHVLLYSLAPRIDPAAPLKDEIAWLVRESLAHLPPESKAADVVRFVLEDYEANPDKSDWERTRDRVHARYQRDAAANGFSYLAWFESSVNLATSTMALLYGGGDYRRTVQIGTLSGWDSDNGTSTQGGLLGFILGPDAVRAAFPGQTISNRYNAARTRVGLPDRLPDDPAADDSFPMMAARMMPLAEKALLEAGAARADNGDWIIPAIPAPDWRANPLWRLHLESANNAVGAMATADAAMPLFSDYQTTTDTLAICNGLEGNFSGRETPAVSKSWIGSLRPGQAEISAAVEWRQPIEARAIRFTEGPHYADGNGPFATVRVEVRRAGEKSWTPIDAKPSEPLRPEQPFQTIDFPLPAPMRIEAARILGRPLKADGFAAVAEVDGVLSPAPSPTPPPPLRPRG